MPANNTHYAILVPGSDKLAFDKDREKAKFHNISVFELNLPSFAGHPVYDQHAHFNIVTNLILAAYDNIKSKYPAARVVAVGRNNGGGQLAWSLAHGFTPTAIVLVGAIPEISRYRKESHAPSAKLFRQSLKGQEEFSRIDEMIPLDITSSSNHWPNLTCLLQFGYDDPYIDETSVDAIKKLKKICRVGWLKDDHKMESEPALTQRWKFIKKQLDS